MQEAIDCIYCYLKQATNCMRISGIDKYRQQYILFELMDEIKKMDREKTPAENSTEILLKVYHHLGTNDPYMDIKKKSNSTALKMYPKLKEKLNKSENRLYDALKISVAGNVIDLGINRDFDINASLEHSLNIGFSKDEFKNFNEKLKNGSDILIIGDNAGEIVFDKLLIEELTGMGKEVTYIVKGGAILNDATMDDIEQVGLDKTANITTTGSNYLGTPLHKVSSKALSLIKNSSLVISKGQANFESLEHEKLTREKTFFLLKIKCDCVGDVAQANLGDIVFFNRK